MVPLVGSEEVDPEVGVYLNRCAVTPFMSLVYQVDKCVLGSI